MKKLACIIASLVSLMVLAGEYEIDWKFTNKNNETFIIELSGEVLANLGGHIDWLRLYDRGNTIVPWAKRQLTEPEYGVKRIVFPLVSDVVRHSDDGQLEILCHLPQGTQLPPEVHLTFHTLIRNFEQKVSVFGIDADQKQRPLLSDGFIFESSANLDLKNLDVSFSPEDCTSFRITLCAASIERSSVLRQVSREWSSEGTANLKENLTVAEQAFKIDRLEMWTIQRTQTGQQPQWSETPASIPTAVTADQNGVISFLLQPRVYPVCGLHIQCKEDNYCRPVRVFSVSKSGKETLLHSGTLKHLVLGRIQDESSVVFPAVEEGMLRVVIENHDNPPIHVTTVSTRHPVYGLVFLGNADMMPCRLTLEPQGKAPVYDTAALLAAGGPSSNAITIRPTKFSGNAFTINEEPVETSGYRRHVLVIAIVLAVLVMGAAIIKTTRNIKE